MGLRLNHTNGQAGSVHKIRYINEFTSLTDAVTVIGSTETRLIVHQDTTLTGNTTIPATLELEVTVSGSINQGSYTLTFSGVDIIAGNYQVFTGTGAVTGLNAAPPQWWGASPSVSATVNKAAFNASFAAAKKVIVPTGTYPLLSDTIILSISSNIIVEFEPGAILQPSTTGSSHRVLSIGSGVTDCKIVNATIDLNYGGSTYSPQGIVVDGSSNVVLDNPKIYNSAVVRAWPNTGWGYGIYLLSTWSNVEINNPHIYDIMYAIAAEDSSTGSVARVNDGVIEHCSGDGVEVNVPTGSASDIIIDGTRFYRIGSDDVARGLGVGASGATGSTITDIKVVNCTFDSCDIAGVHIEDGTQSATVSNNHFYACGTATATSFGAAIYVAATDVNRSISSVKLTDNRITGTADTDYGIYCGGAATGVDLKITNNIISGVGNGNGIFIGSSWGRTDCNYNTVRNCKGPGIVYSATTGAIVGNTCYDNQTPKTQTYGLELTALAYSPTIRDNNFFDNTNKGILLTSLASPKQVSNYKERVTDIAANATANTAWIPVIKAGLAFNGTLYINWLRAADRNIRASILYSLSYDGTTLTATPLAMQNNGGLAVTLTVATNLKINAGWLEVLVYHGGAAPVTDIILEAIFDGSIMLK